VQTPQVALFATFNDIVSTGWKAKSLLAGVCGGKVQIDSKSARQSMTARPIRAGITL
jgi:hypothetical protein